MADIIPAVEAIQCVLEGLGTVLYPSDEYILKPYPHIYDEDIVRLELRVFAKPNELGHFIKFKRNEAAMRWELDNELH